MYVCHISVRCLPFSSFESNNDAISASEEHTKLKSGHFIHYSFNIKNIVDVVINLPEEFNEMEY